MVELEEYKSFIRGVVEQTGGLIRRYWDAPDIGEERKADDTPVTRADREAELLLREAIERRFPGHGILGEEFPDVRPGADFLWILDPIDGTKSFISHVPLFGTLIGLLHEGKPILGAIHQPILNELLIGDNHTAELNGYSVRVRPCPSLAEATVLTTDLGLAEKPPVEARMRDLLARCRLKRTWGDCYGYLLLATGRADVMLDPIMAKWDILPLIPIVRGAGGIITDWSGNDPVSGNSAVAASPGLHAEVLASLQA